MKYKRNKKIVVSVITYGSRRSVVYNWGVSGHFGVFGHFSLKNHTWKFKILFWIILILHAQIVIKNVLLLQNAWYPPIVHYQQTLQ